MARSTLIAATLAAALFAPAAAGAQIELAPVVTGLSNPLFVTHAGDGTGRQFIVERDGAVRVLHSGERTPTVFLDIRERVIAGGEQGLLGLAFHPRYATTGRFFVYYTRREDGALVIAEYRVSLNADAADRAERVLLTIPHPTFSNHNGGMLAFGHDGYLYAGIGDGGSANDPANNAQNPDVLLGKLLRIDVDTAAAGLPYRPPADNPFVSGPGRDEIFALGLRNPWRFSIDRATGEIWLGDVGQGAREEVNAPIVSGGNYGWRIYEGFLCVSRDPLQCNPTDYVGPIFDYAHTGGRCSLTGGHVYRGSRGTLPSGTYVYGDYCSGEIFTWDGSSQRVLLDTTMNISSFGEDEDGELYVVDLGGTVSRLVSTAPPSCVHSIRPSAATVSLRGGAATIAVTTGPGCQWTAESHVAWIALTGATNGTGGGTVTLSVAPFLGRTAKRVGTVTIAGIPLTITQAR